MGKMKDIDYDVTLYWRLLDKYNEAGRYNEAEKEAWEAHIQYFERRYGFSPLHAHLYILKRGLRFEVYGEYYEEDAV